MNPDVKKKGGKDMVNIDVHNEDHDIDRYITCLSNWRSLSVLLGLTTTTNALKCSEDD